MSLSQLGIGALHHAYTSFAFIVIFAFSTFETGHPFSAASAYFWNVAASAPGTLPTTSIWLAVIVQPESPFPGNCQHELCPSRRASQGRSQLHYSTRSWQR